MLKRNILTVFFLATAFAAFGQGAMEEISVNNIRMLNSSNEDFIIVPYGDGIMYNTNVKDNKCDTCRFQNLRFAQQKMEGGGDCDFAPGVVVPNDFNVKYNYGAPTFSQDGKMMIISENNRKPRKSDRRLTLKLVSATLSDQNAWVKGADLPFNSNEFETTHPALSADGQTLYFASDRPGSIGGMDIWMAKKQGDTWGIPTNLGAPINTTDNELFPSIGQNGALYYSSNKPGGMGMLDIYKATHDGTVWSIMSMEAPINSASDDMGFVELPDGESGYLTSDRAGGLGKDDLYCWKVNPAKVQLIVEDATDSNIKLPGSAISITSAAVGATALAYTADAKGGAQPDIKFRRNYTIEVEKEGYQPWTKDVSAKELAAVETYVVPLVPKAYSMVGDVKQIGNDIFEPGSKVVLRNLATGEEREVTADANGQFKFDNLRCFESYKLIATKGDRTSEEYNLSASMIDCNSDEPTKATLRLPVPPPLVPLCACNDVGMLSLPVDATPKSISALGSRPQFGDSHALDATGFYNKLQQRYGASKRDATFLDDLFKSMGFENGFSDADAGLFSDTVIENGRTGNMGYTKFHRMKYVQLNAKSDRDLAAFRVAATNGCDVYFMKTCGNLFFFCNN
ncbi:MAG: hypothetical protein AAF960_18005 [Bacteroidota bacterium]